MSSFLSMGKECLHCAVNPSFAVSGPGVSEILEGTWEPGTNAIFNDANESHSGNQLFGGQAT